MSFLTLKLLRSIGVCEFTSCAKTVVQYFIFGNNNIHTNVLLNGEQHVNIGFLMKMQTGQKKKVLFSFQTLMGITKV